MHYATSEFEIWISKWSGFEIGLENFESKSRPESENDFAMSVLIRDMNLRVIKRAPKFPDSFEK